MVPVAVDCRCEFLSEAWVREATAFLNAAVANRPELRSIRLSVCESFWDSPEALADADGCVAWNFALDHGVVRAAFGECPDAQARVTGSYQAAVSHAQVVWAAGEDAVARSRRELRHRFGNADVQVSGELPNDGATALLLADLHDHMAARTVENPNFEHRVEQLGVSGAVQQLEELGYAVLENAITPQMADELHELTATEVTRHHPLTTNGLMMRDRRFEEIAQHSGVCTVAQSAVGQNMILGAMSGTYKETGPGAIPLHSDYPLVREPFPEFGLIAVAVWALQDWDSEAVGTTWVLPGSHRYRRPPREDDDTSAAIPVLMPKGSVLLISHGIWHWQGDRAAPGARVAIHVTYNRIFVRPLDDFSSVNDTHYARNPPAFSTLLGRDDPFGKSSYQGHDGARFAYAGRFTQT